MTCITDVSAVGADVIAFLGIIVIILWIFSVVEYEPTSRLQSLGKFHRGRTWNMYWD